MTQSELKELTNLGAELWAAKAEVERLREALRWYEEKVAECRKIGSLGDNARQALDRDGGFRARDALSQQAESTPAAVPDSGDAFYAGLYKKSAPMWHRLHDLAVSKGYDHVRFAIECAPAYKCDCMGARKVAIDTAGNTIPCECVAAANEAEPVRCEYCDGTGDVHRADGEWLGGCKECDAAEPAPVQDEREMGELRIRLENGRRQFEFEEYDAAYSLPAGTHYLYTRPAQTEQQPLAWLIDWPEEPELGHYFSDEPNEHARSRPLYAAPIAQTAPQPEQSGLVEAVTPEIIDWVRCGLSVNGRLVDGTHPALDKLRAAYRTALSAQGCKA